MAGWGDIPVMSNSRVKLEESEKLEKYLNLVNELNNLYILSVLIVPISNSMLGIVLKILAKGLAELDIQERSKIIQMTALQRSA